MIEFVYPLTLAINAGVELLFIIWLPSLFAVYHPLKVYVDVKFDVDDIVALVEFLESDVSKPDTVYILFGNVIVVGFIVDELYVAVILVVPSVVAPLPFNVII